jgi:NADH-quinone oxidoreductase subunit J
VSNPIHSVLFLILLFCNIALLLLLFDIEFLALMLIIIYVGAVSILFLFVLMMLDIQIVNPHLNDWYNYLLFVSFVMLAFFNETFLCTIGFLNKNVLPDYLVSSVPWVCLFDNVTNIETFGQTLYTFYFFFFLLAGLSLLIGLIGAVLLTFETQTEKTVDISMFKQVSRLKNNAVFNIK